MSLMMRLMTLVLLSVLNSCGGNPVLISKKYPLCEKNALDKWVCSVETGDGMIDLIEPSAPATIEVPVEVPVYIEGETIVIYRDRVVYTPRTCPKIGNRNTQDNSSDDSSSDDD